MKKKFIALSMLMFASSSHYMIGSGKSGGRLAEASQSTARTSAAKEKARTLEDMKKHEEIRPEFEKFLKENQAKKAAEATKTEQFNEHSSTGVELTDLSEQSSIPQDSLSFEAQKPTAPAGSAKKASSFQRVNQQLNSVASSAYKSIASLGTPEGRQKFVTSVSTMFTNAGKSAPSAASFRAFFSKITPSMSMQSFTALFKKTFENFQKSKNDAPGAEKPGKQQTENLLSLTDAVEYQPLTETERKIERKSEEELEAELRVEQANLAKLLAQKELLAELLAEKQSLAEALS